MKTKPRLWMQQITSAATLLCGIVTISCGTIAFAQQASEQPAAATAKLRPLAEIAKIRVPALNLVQLQLEDEANFQKGMPPRYALANPVNYTPSNSGTWERLDRQTSVWRLQAESPNAMHMNLGFTRFFMPTGGRLYVYNPDMSAIVRPFTAADNAPHGELWTPPVGGATIVIELTIPDNQINQLQLTLGSINAGYKRIGPFGAGGGGVDSGACNVDVVCPEGVPWANEIPCVGNLSIGGSFFCTGFLVNNTAQDRKPYLLTANHCGINSGNAPSLVVYWNYQNSTCRPVNSGASGGAGNGSLATFSSGSTFRAGSSTASDFTLVELTTQPNPAWLLSWAGWDRTGVQSPNGACIHHPSNDEKRITFYTTTTDSGACGFSGPHVRAFWSLGVTEPGSSGSPLFDTNHRVIGQLHGGPSACGVAPGNLNDCYGRFSSSWTGGGTNSTRLSNWLDPGNTGVTTLNTIITTPPPVNDTCANASTKSTGSSSFTNVGASTDGPDEPGACTVSGYSQIGNDVWYKWIASCTGTATVSLCGASYDTKMAVYGACPTGSGQYLACNDDFCGLSSQVSFAVNSGTIYRIRVGGFNGATGTGTMVISCTPAAATGACCNANGSCTGNVTQAACTSGGGTYQGNNVTCGAVSCPQPCPPDVNHDGQVNVTDLLAVINSWGACPGCPADINNDGQVNVTDLLAVINGWGPCP